MIVVLKGVLYVVEIVHADAAEFFTSLLRLGDGYQLVDFAIVPDAESFGGLHELFVKFRHG